MTGSKINIWEIWYAFFAYEDDPTQGKERPVLVIPNGNFIRALKITSSNPRTVYDYQIINYHQAGLSTASVVRLDKELPLFESDLINRKGRLHPVDISNIKNLMSQYSLL